MVVFHCASSNHYWCLVTAGFLTLRCCSCLADWYQAAQWPSCSCGSSHWNCYSIVESAWSFSMNDCSRFLSHRPDQLDLLWQTCHLCLVAVGLECRLTTSTHPLSFVYLLGRARWSLRLHFDSWSCCTLCEAWLTSCHPLLSWMKPRSVGQIHRRCFSPIQQRTLSWCCVYLNSAFSDDTDGDLVCLVQNWLPFRSHFNLRPSC